MIIPELSFVRYPSLLYLSSLECIVILINELELEIFVEKMIIFGSFFVKLSL